MKNSRTTTSEEMYIIKVGKRFFVKKYFRSLSTESTVTLTDRTDNALQFIFKGIGFKDDDDYTKTIIEELLRITGGTLISMKVKTDVEKTFEEVTLPVEVNEQ